MRYGSSEAPGMPEGKTKNVQGGSSIFAHRALVRSGFFDVDLAQRFLASEEITAFLEDSGLSPDRLTSELSVAASPDIALKYLVLLLCRQPRIREMLHDSENRRQFLTLLGSGTSWGEFFLGNLGSSDSAVNFPGILGESFGVDSKTLDLYREPAEKFREATGYILSDFLRVKYRQEVMRIVLRDIMGEDPLRDISDRMAELSDAAAVVLEYAAAAAQAEYARAHGAEIPLGIVALGKTGGRELNYVSDVDVIFVTDTQEHVPGAEQIARGILKIISVSSGNQLPLWQIDTNLRPEGKDGALVRTVESYKNYYDSWAGDWEFQVLLKARAAAGNPVLGRKFVELSGSYVWGGAAREGFVEGVQRMRQQVIDNIASNEQDREIKLGRGGLRDVEFTVQLLQLVHGRSDRSVHARDTLTALQQLAKAGYISRDDARKLEESYRFLRLLEHRIQLLSFRRTHVMPVGERERTMLSRSFRNVTAREHRTAPKGSDTRESAVELTARWQAVKRQVRGLYEQIVYRPLLPVAASMEAADIRLSSQAVLERLQALGYKDPHIALASIRALSDGVSRRATLQKQLLPVLLMWISQGANPDAGLLGFRRVSEALGNSPWYLRMLRDSSEAAERLCCLLAASPVITELLESSTDAVFWLGDDKRLRPRSYEELWQEVAAKITRLKLADGSVPTPVPQERMKTAVAELIRVVRAVRQRELLRIIVADGCGLLSYDELAQAIFAVERMAISGFLHAAQVAEYSAEGHLVDIIAVFMGRFGGVEAGYASDVDVTFAYEVHSDAGRGDGFAVEAQRQAERIVHAVVSYAKQPVTPAIRSEIPLAYDTGLRPEGRDGVLVRSVESYRAYYENWAQAWEIQALLRARVVAGNAVFAEKFTAFLDSVRYPVELGSERLKEIRRIKARVESERIPGAIDPRRHLKLGPGAVSDVEWLAQVFQLEYAHRYVQLRTQSTVAVLRALVQEGLMEREDSLVLECSWRLASSIRNANVVTGSPKDVLPGAGGSAEPVARWASVELRRELAENGGILDIEELFGNIFEYQEKGLNGANLEEVYFRVTRHSRTVFEKYFFN